MNHSKYQANVLSIALLAVSVSSATHAADPQLPPEVYGRYAPGGDCTKQPRIIVDKAGVHLDTTAGQRASLPIAVSFTAIGGMNYDGIQIWAWIKHGGKNRYGDDNDPVILTFNAGEKLGALSAERSEPGTERPVALDGPLTSIVQTASFHLCSADGR